MADEPEPEMPLMLYVGRDVVGSRMQNISRCLTCESKDKVHHLYSQPAAHFYDVHTTPAKRRYRNRHRNTPFNGRHTKTLEWKDVTDGSPYRYIPKSTINEQGRRIIYNKNTINKDIPELDNENETTGEVEMLDAFEKDSMKEDENGSGQVEKDTLISKETEMEFAKAQWLAQCEEFEHRRATFEEKQQEVSKLLEELQGNEAALQFKRDSLGERIEQFSKESKAVEQEEAQLNSDWERLTARKNCTSIKRTELELLDKVTCLQEKIDQLETELSAHKQLSLSQQLGFDVVAQTNDKYPRKTVLIGAELLDTLVILSRSYLLMSTTQSPFPQHLLATYTIPVISNTGTIPVKRLSADIGSNLPRLLANSKRTLFIDGNDIDTTPDEESKLGNVSRIVDYFRSFDTVNVCLVFNDTSNSRLKDMEEALKGKASLEISNEQGYILKTVIQQHGLLLSTSTFEEYVQNPLNPRGLRSYLDRRQLKWDCVETRIAFKTRLSDTEEMTQEELRDFLKNDYSQRDIIETIDRWIAESVVTRFDRDNEIIIPKSCPTRTNSSLASHFNMKYEDEIRRIYLKNQFQ